MEIVLQNKTRDKAYKEYKPLFMDVASAAEKVLKLDRNYVISVIMVKSRKIHEINRDYRGIDRPTDVISFAINDVEDDYEMMDESQSNELGDIFINVDYAIKQSEEYGHSLRREMGFLFAHGLLHCLGYDHMKPEDEKIMFKLQDEIIDQVVTRNE